MFKFFRKYFYALPASYILMFHHIDNGSLIKRSGCMLNYQEFINLLDSGLQFISLHDLLSLKKLIPGKCSITFDDGLKDVYSVAYPELKKRNIPFSIFVITDFLGKKGYITNEELIELSKDPLVTIGSHGVSHELLPNMSYLKQMYELTESKRKLEAITNLHINYFAFSHGQYDKNTKRILKKHKFYNFVFGVRGYPLNIITKRWKYNLPRINFENNKVTYCVQFVNGKYLLKKIK